MPAALNRAGALQPTPGEKEVVRPYPGRTVHPAGQAHVGDQEIDLSVRKQHAQACRGICRLDGQIAHAFRHLGHEGAHHRLVIHDQHSSAGGDIGHAWRFYWRLGDVLDPERVRKI